MTLPTSLPLLPPVDYHFTSKAGGAVVWHVRAMQILEELSGEFQARIEIEADDPMADPAALLGASATLTLSRRTLPPVVRRWSGIVRRVEETVATDAMKHRQGVITLEPAFGCLKESLLTRKFQELTVPGVLREALADVEGPFERE